MGTADLMIVFGIERSVAWLPHDSVDAKCSRPGKRLRSIKNASLDYSLVEPGIGKSVLGTHFAAVAKPHANRPPVGTTCRGNSLNRCAIRLRSA
jgi:hypothetical protein